MLAERHLWYSQGSPQTLESTITEQTFLDSYVPGDEAVAESWDASASLDGSVTCYVIGTKLIVAGNGSGKISLNRDCTMFFVDANNGLPLPNNTRIFSKQVKINNTELLDASKVEVLSSFFNGAYALRSIDMSSLDLSNVQSMNGMFYMSGLEEINLTNWYTPKLLDVSFIFCSYPNFSGGTGVRSLIGLSDWQQPNITKAANAFTGTAFESLDLTNWNVDNIEDFSGIFMNMANLTQLNISTWKPQRVTNTRMMFQGAAKLTTVDLSNFTYADDFQDNGSMFFGCTSLEELSLPQNFCMHHTKNGPTMLISRQFYDCSKLKHLDASNWRFDGNLSLDHAFANCSALAGLDTSKWNLSECTDLSFTFYGCSSLREIDVSKWDVSKVKNFDHFAAHAGLIRKGIENWDTSSAENMNAMFHNCGEIELDLSRFKTDKVIYFTQMFENSPRLKHIRGLDKWTTGQATGFDQMFGRCYELEELDLSSFDTRKAKNGETASTNGHKTGTLENFCNDCRKLKWIKLGPNFAINGDGSNTTAANKLILPTPSADYINGADGLWRTVDGTTYSPTGIPDKTLNTYYSSYGGICDVDVIVKNGSLLDTAKAIRELSGATEKYTPAQFGAAIRAAAAALNAMADEILNEQAEHIEGGVSDVTTE